MAYTNFKATVWSKQIQQALPLYSTLADDCNHQYKGEVGLGKSVKILGVAEPTIGDYYGTNIGAPETVSDEGQILSINNAKYFNVMVDDVDEAQATEGLMEAILSNAARAMAKARDAYVAEYVASESAHGNGGGEEITTPEAAKRAIDNGLKTLWNNGVTPNDDVTIYLNPTVYLLFQEYITSIKTSNDEAIASGVLGKYCGAKIKMSDSLFKDSDGSQVLFMKTARSLAFVSGIDEVEAYRPEGLFSDAVKGLNTFGCKLIYPDELYTIRVL